MENIKESCSVIQNQNVSEAEKLQEHAALVLKATSLVTQGQAMHAKLLAEFDVVGRDVLARKIQTEVEVLKKLLNSQKLLKEENIVSSNLHQLCAVVQLSCYIGSARVECFNQKLRDEEYKPVYVDITTKPAHIWIKVVCRSANSLQLAHLTGARRSAEESARAMVNLSPPTTSHKIVLVLCGGASPSVCHSLGRLGNVIVMTPAVVPDHLLKASQYAVSSVSSSSEDEDCFETNSEANKISFKDDFKSDHYDPSLTINEDDSMLYFAGCVNKINSSHEFRNNLTKRIFVYTDTISSSDILCEDTINYSKNAIVECNESQVISKCNESQVISKCNESNISKISQIYCDNFLENILPHSISSHIFLATEKNEENENEPIVIKSEIGCSEEDDCLVLDERKVLKEIAKGRKTLVFLDVPTLIAYVSDISNGRVRDIPNSTSQISRFLRQQADWEQDAPIKPIIDDFCKGAYVAICLEARRRFLEIVALVGGPREAARARQLLGRLLLLPDCGDGEAGGGSSLHSRRIFATARHFGAAIVTANYKFVRAARQSGQYVTSYMHQPRALSERKVIESTVNMD